MVGPLVQNGGPSRLILEREARSHTVVFKKFVAKETHHTERSRGVVMLDLERAGSSL